MISFCTSCNGRVHHIKQTYKHNIEIGRGHDFVLVGYGKDKELDDYVRDEIFPFIPHRDNVGALKMKVNFNYYQVDVPYFHMSKSKNLSHRLACGDFLVCLDADTFIGTRMVEKSTLCYEENKYLSPHWTNDIYGLSKENFYNLGGYDETFEGWGVEDVDLRVRCNNMGLTGMNMPPQAFNSIPHSDEERVSNYALEFRKRDNGNYKKMKLHEKEKTIKVNPNGFAKHKVIKNFKEGFII